MDALSSLLGGDSLLGIFNDTINGWMGSLITAAFEKFDAQMISLLRGAFYFENLAISGADAALSEQSIRDVYFYIYGFACSLVILKFLFKGFHIYILWRDGDADVSPRDMLVGMLEAAAVMVCFPYLYEKLANICVAFAEGIMARLGVSLGLVIVPDLNLILSQGILTILILLVFVISILVLWIQLIGRGFELLILRFGVPLASLGLLDSDISLLGSIRRLHTTPLCVGSIRMHRSTYAPCVLCFPIRCTASCWRRHANAAGGAPSAAPRGGRPKGRFTS